MAAARSTTRKKKSSRKKSGGRKKAGGRKKTATRKKSTGGRKKAGRKKSGRKKKSSRKYSPSAGENVREEMHEFKRGKLKSGPGGKGGKVKSRKQAIAIGLSEARAEGKKVPSPPKRRARKKS
jgi:hypothetical protein